jgi:Ni,Fe-hydrogenase III large subunit/Ni,Fe-hydrogenase III component G
VNRAGVVDARTVARDDLASEFAAQLGAGFRLAMVACHEDDDDFRIVYVLTATHPSRIVELVVSVPRNDQWVPTLAALSYPAGRFEREVRDLFGIDPRGHPLPQRLLRHAHWPRGWHPMLREADPAPTFEPDTGSVPFHEVEGEGVYEIPVGPVHAGLIEPGHFRFSVIGETIIRMKARLWFLHRGVEKHFQGRHPEDGIELADRISGDTAIGHSVAYAMAVESAAGIDVSEPDRLLRGVLLELERLYNHVADLGALANDVGFGIANAHAQRLRETLLRLNKATTGHRLLRGAVTIGGTRVQALPDPHVLAQVAAEVEELVAITLGHSAVRDRFSGTAVLTREQALAIGTLGYVARASGLDVDARRDHPFVELGPALTVTVEDTGDVLARYRVRAREYAASTRLILQLLDRLSGQCGSGRAATPHGPGAGIGIVEGWRGTVVHRVELGPNGQLSRVKVVDPSFFNWPALPIALADTIVPDFPLANKSFNQSYAGNDL